MNALHIHSCPPLFMSRQGPRGSRESGALPHRMASHPPAQARRRGSVAAATIAAAALASAASATTWYVSPCGSDAWLGLNPGCLAPSGPKRTIQAALAVAGDGDAIHLLPGSYAGPIDLDGKAIHLLGLTGPGATIIDGNGNGPVVLCNSLEGSDTVIEGVTITGGEVAGDGGGMFISLASPTIIDCVISGNEAGDLGGGVAVVLGSPSFLECVISYNHADNGGGGVSTSFGSPTFGLCTIVGNSSGFHGGGMATSGGTPSIAGSAVIGNSAAMGGGIHHALGSLDIDGCIIDDNEALVDGGGVLVLDAALSVSDSSLFGNVAVDDGGGIAALGGELDLEEVVLSVNEADYGGGLSAVNGADVSMVACSVAGNVAVASCGGLSFVDASVWLQGGSVSENTGGTIGGLGASGGELEAFGVSFTGNSGAWLCGGVGLWDTSADSTRFVLCGFHDNLGAFGGGALAIAAGSVSVESSVLDGNAAVSGGAIAIMTQTFGDGASALVALRGCVLSSNTAAAGGGAVFMEADASLLAMATRFVNNVAEGTTGGAIAAWDATLVLSRCDLFDNSAPDGGAAHVVGGALACSNSVLADNSAEGRGGAFHLGSLEPSHIANCTITGNSAGDEGDGIYAWSGDGLTITNSIIWSNGWPGVEGNDLPLAQYSIVPAAIAGPGCFSANPQFVDAATDDYRLSPTSTAIDAGLLSLLPPDIGDADDDGDATEPVEVDRDGQPRVASAAADQGMCSLMLDLGAYEAAGMATSVLPGDLDGDGAVGSSDLGLVLAAWGDAEGCPAADLNGDGVVNGSDLGVVLANWS